MKTNISIPLVLAAVLLATNAFAADPSRTQSFATNDAGYRNDSLGAHGTAPSPLVQDQQAFDFPNHHMHTFQVSESTYEHAVAMGYRLVVYSGSNWAGKPEYKHLGKIMNHNSDVSPLRIHARKSDGKLFVSYFARTGATADHLNAVALQNGVRRVCEKQTEMNADDLQLLKGFGAARLPVDDLTLENVTYAEIKKRFHTSWPLENNAFESCNVRCNWQSRKVVKDMIKAALENIRWTRYDALFFDSLSGNIASAVNAEFGGLGSYPRLPDGKLAFVNALIEYVRNPLNTGRPRPYAVFANIWNPMSRGSQFQSWYGTGKLRMDHYYFEQGSQVGDKARYLYKLETQRANGVVPGSSQPAYVPRDKSGNLEHPEAYLPARLVAVDDAYTWSRLRSRLPNFDHAAFFEQHLDACGAAGIQGSWFGWYGEDYIDIKDSEGRLIYSNACQLLRAIPNWDNMRRIPVPPFSDYSATDERAWNGEIYRSTHSYASHAVVYSRNPDNEELYAVFCSETATVQLLPGETPVSARFVNPWFSKTDEDAFPSLKISPQEGTIKLMNSDKLGRGVRITTIRERR